MRSTTLLTATMAYQALVAALPNSLPNPAGVGFTLSLIKRQMPHTEDIDKRAGSLKTSVSIQSLQPATEKWTIDLKVGNQTLPVVLDTGSQDFWMESTLMPPNMTGSNHPLYTPPTSSPIPGLNWTAKFDFSSVAARGVAYYDKVTIGGATITSQVVGAATSLASNSTVRKSGILGLNASPNQINYDKSVQPRTVMQNLQDQLNITQFAVDLRTDNRSCLDFGFADSTKYTGQIAYLNRSSYGNWMVNIDNAYYINKVRQVGNMSSNGLTHVDSGAPNMNFPVTIVQNYYNNITNSSRASDGTFLIPCSVISSGKMPSFGISYNGVEIDVPGGWMWSAQYGKTCVGALQASANGSYSVLGDMFMRTVYTVFDLKGPSGQGQVGFATKTLPARALPT